MQLANFSVIFAYYKMIPVLDVTEIPCTASRGAEADLIVTHLRPKYVVPPGIVNPK